jgi:hypothetical protein
MAVRARNEKLGRRLERRTSVRMSMEEEGRKRGGGRGEEESGTYVIRHDIDAIRHLPSKLHRRS